MAKVMLELEEQDARIVAACIGLAIHTISSPQELLQSVFKPNQRALIVTLLGLMGGMQTKEELRDAILSPGSPAFDASLDSMMAKTHQLTKLMRAILHQTDPDQVPSPT